MRPLVGRRLSIKKERSTLNSCCWPKKRQLRDGFAAKRTSCSPKKHPRVDIGNCCIHFSISCILHDHFVLVVKLVAWFYKVFVLLMIYTIVDYCLHGFICVWSYFRILYDFGSPLCDFIWRLKLFCDVRCYTCGMCYTFVSFLRV